MESAATAPPTRRRTVAQIVRAADDAGAPPPPPPKRSRPARGGVVPSPPASPQPCDDVVPPPAAAAAVVPPANPWACHGALAPFAPVAPLTTSDTEPDELAAYDDDNNGFVTAARAALCTAAAVAPVPRAPRTLTAVGFDPVVRVGRVWRAVFADATAPATWGAVMEREYATRFRAEVLDLAHAIDLALRPIVAAGQLERVFVQRVKQLPVVRRAPLLPLLRLFIDPSVLMMHRAGHTVSSLLYGGGTGVAPPMACEEIGLWARGAEFGTQSVRRLFDGLYETRREPTSWVNPLAAQTYALVHGVDVNTYDTIEPTTTTTPPPPPTMTPPTTTPGAAIECAVRGVCVSLNRYMTARAMLERAPIATDDIDWIAGNATQTVYNVAHATAQRIDTASAHVAELVRPGASGLKALSAAWRTLEITQRVEALGGGGGDGVVAPVDEATFGADRARAADQLRDVLDGMAAIRRRALTMYIDRLAKLAVSDAGALAQQTGERAAVPAGVRALIAATQARVCRILEAARAEPRGEASSSLTPVASVGRALASLVDAHPLARPDGAAAAITAAQRLSDDDRAAVLAMWAATRDAVRATCEVLQAVAFRARDAAVLRVPVAADSAVARAAVSPDALRAFEALLTRELARCVDRVHK